MQKCFSERIIWRLYTGIFFHEEMKAPYHDVQEMTHSKPENIMESVSSSVSDITNTAWKNVSVDELHHESDREVTVFEQSDRTPYNSEISMLWDLEEFVWMLEMSTEFTDISDRFTELYFVLSEENKQNILPYVWLMVRKVRDVLVQESYTRSQKLFFSKELDKIIEKYRYDKNFPSLIPRDLHQFFSDIYDIEYHPPKK